MKKAKRTTISIPTGLYTAAQRMRKDDHFASFSGFVQHLIRVEYERRLESKAVSQAEVGAGRTDANMNQAMKRILGETKDDFS